MPYYVFIGVSGFQVNHHTPQLPNLNLCFCAPPVDCQVAMYSFGAYGLSVTNAGTYARVILAYLLYPASRSHCKATPL